MRAHVVVGTDGSPFSLAAVEWAAADAARRRCALRIVHAYDPRAYDIPVRTPPGLRDSILEHCQGLLDTAESTARERAPGTEVHTRLEAGRPVEVLRREAEDAAQVVVGGRGRGGFAELVLGSVSLALAGHAAAPVVVVKGGPRETRGEVVVGFDASAHSAATLAYAFEEAYRRAAGLHAVHTWQMPVLGPGAIAYTPLVEDISVTELRLAREALAPWREKYPEVDVVETVVRGHPVPAIEKASATADLVVVGSRGRSALGAALLGSVSHGVLHHVHCPVAVVSVPDGA
ncbi:universal stress protein [Streptosporangium fragile]|uniref:Universal stress protein n=1 Tax=Streptosporangium fragile TaxID=46186 RepID=A0ABN3W0V4_9ACTN